MTRERQHVATILVLRCVKGSSNRAPNRDRPGELTLTLKGEGHLEGIGSWPPFRMSVGAVGCSNRKGLAVRAAYATCQRARGPQKGSDNATRAPSSSDVEGRLTRILGSQKCL